VTWHHAVRVTTYTTFSLGLIADDLTGATDTAVQFARRGWGAFLALDVPSLTTEQARGSDPSEDLTHSVLAVTTDARALGNERAEARTADAASRLLEAGVERLYLKIDSTMRGSVPGQIAGVLAAWRTRYHDAVAVVCPAYPSMGRTVFDNHLMVGGLSVELSPIGRDPVTPVTTGNLAVLIPGSTHVLPEELPQNEAPVVTMDARSDQDLANVAAAIAAVGPSAIAVGSAGLANAMSAIWSATAVARSTTEASALGSLRSPRVIIQISSLNPVSHAQLARLGEVYPDAVVLSGRAENVAATLVDHVERERWDLIGLIGGDGARAALRLLGASGIRIVDTLLEGIPLGVVVGGRADGMLIFTKAGGFGADDALIRVVERIRA